MKIQNKLFPIEFQGLFHWCNSKYRRLDSVSFWGHHNEYLTKCDYWFRYVLQHVKLDGLLNRVL
jgi:hypothetical protein